MAVRDRLRAKHPVSVFSGGETPRGSPVAGRVIWRSIRACRRAARIRRRLTPMNALFSKIGHGIAAYLSKPIRQGTQVATHSYEFLAATLRPGDVLLVEGNTRISVAIKYLTQSTWSHATFF